MARICSAEFRMDKPTREASSCTPMHRRILILDAHPDPKPERFVHALAQAYASAAAEAGHQVKLLQLADLAFPLLRSSAEYREQEAPPAIQEAQREIAASNHLVVLFPLWLGSMPALLKGFFEQVFRPGFAFGSEKTRGFPAKKLRGRSARIVVTMGMPGSFYRFYYGAHAIKLLERNILKFVGFAPVRSTIIGSVEGSDAHRERSLAAMQRLGRAGT